MEAIDRYIREAGITRSEFAKRIGITPGRLSQLLNHSEERPSLDLVDRIVAATGGKVKPADFVRAAE